MKKYGEDYRSRLAVAVYEKAEQLASEVNSEGLNNHTMQVEFENDLYEFIVDCMTSNVEYDDTTNSGSYNVEIFCTNILHVEDKDLFSFLKNEFGLETLYKD